MKVDDGFCPLLCHWTPPPKVNGNECFHVVYVYVLIKFLLFMIIFILHTTFFFFLCWLYFTFSCNKAIFLYIIIIYFSFTLSPASAPTHPPFRTTWLILIPVITLKFNLFFLENAILNTTSLPSRAFYLHHNYKQLKSFFLPVVITWVSQSSVFCILTLYPSVDCGPFKICNRNLFTYCTFIIWESDFYTFL